MVKAEVMVKPVFEKLGIELWIHRERLGATHRSLCVFHDSLENGGQLLVAIEELKQEPRPSQRNGP
jgi:hypothetical protein